MKLSLPKIKNSAPPKTCWNANYNLPTKQNFFQKAQHVRAFLGWFGDAESKKHISFAKLALVFELFYDLRRYSP